MLGILEGPATFVFDKPLLLKKYETSMVSGKHLLKSCPVWVRFPRLGLHFWTPKILGKLACKIRKALLADKHTIRKTKLGAPMLHIDLYPTEEPPTLIKFRGGQNFLTQEIQYE